MKKIIVLLVCLGMLSGCVSSNQSKVKKQLELAFNAIANCDLSSKTLQPLFFSDLESTMYRLQKYSDVEMAMMCGLYSLMYDQTWTIKSVDIINDNAIVTVVFTHYDTKRFIDDLTLHLAGIFGNQYLLEDQEKALAVEPSLDDGQLKEIKDIIAQFVEDKGKDYAFSSYQTTTITLIYEHNTWLIQGLEQLSFVVE